MTPRDPAQDEQQHESQETEARDEETSTGDPSQKPPTIIGQFARRAPRYLLLVAVVVLVTQVVGRRPSKVDVDYQLGKQHHRLLEMRLAYRQKKEVFVRKQLSFRSQKAPKTLRHRVHLPDGDYQVDVQLRFKTPCKPCERTLRRPLLVRGSGTVRIFLEAR